MMKEGMEDDESGAAKSIPPRIIRPQGQLFGHGSDPQEGGGNYVGGGNYLYRTRFSGRRWGGP